MEKMKIKEFAEYVKERLPEYLGRYYECEVSLEEITKPNDTNVYSVSVNIGGNVVPRLTLNGF